MAGTQRFPHLQSAPGFVSQQAPPCLLPLLPWTSYGMRLCSEPPRHRGHGCFTLVMVKQCRLLTEGQGDAKGIWQLTWCQGTLLKRHGAASSPCPHPAPSYLLTAEVHQVLPIETDIAPLEDIVPVGMAEKWGCWERDDTPKDSTSPHRPPLPPRMAAQRPLQQS